MESKSWRPAAVFVLGASLFLAGCDSTGSDGTPTSVRPSVATDVPAGYDPCKDIPQSLLTAQKLRNKTPDDANASGGIKWRGCLWAQSDGYGVSIRTTNITLAMVRAKGFPDTNQYTIAGRSSLTSRQLDDTPEIACTLNVDMKGGSLEFGLSNSPSAPDTGDRNSCELVRELADKVVPTIPAGA